MAWAHPVIRMVHSPWSLFEGVDGLGTGWYTHLEVCYEGVDGLGTPWDQNGILTLKSVLRVLMAWAHPGIRAVYLRRQASCIGT